MSARGITPKAAPRLLLGATSLELPARTTRDRALEVAGRFREPESLAVTLVKALDAGAEAIYSGPSATLRAALAELRRPVPVLARLPHTPPAEDLFHEPWLTRESHDDGQGQGWGGVRASVVGLTMPRAAFRGDMVARLAGRLEHERDALGAKVVSGLAVSSPVTDLALAAGNARFFEQMVRFGRSRFGGLAGFETRNIGHLLAQLEAWGIAPDFVIGPVNARGFGMVPGRAQVIAAIKRSGLPVVASELRAGGTELLADGASHALENGVTGLLPELVDLDDVAGELRALAALR